MAADTQEQAIRVRSGAAKSEEFAVTTSQLNQYTIRAHRERNGTEQRAFDEKEIGRAKALAVRLRPASPATKGQPEANASHDNDEDDKHGELNCYKIHRNADCRGRAHNRLTEWVDGT